jgi:hypothetical protein
VSWQIVASMPGGLAQEKNPVIFENLMKVLLKMNTLDIAELKRAYERGLYSPVIGRTGPCRMCGRELSRWRHGNAGG